MAIRLSKWSYGQWEYQNCAAVLSPEQTEGDLDRAMGGPVLNEHGEVKGLLGGVDPNTWVKVPMRASQMQMTYTASSSAVPIDEVFEKRTCKNWLAQRKNAGEGLELSTDAASTGRLPG
jgi:hypothetical protein